MSKRFTDTEKWQDQWFNNLQNKYKLFWVYICDNCNHAGIWKVNKKLVEYHLGKLDWNLIDMDFKKRIIILNDEKWFIPKFIKFQYPRGLSEKFDAHRSVIIILKENDLLNHISFIHDSRMNHVSIRDDSSQEDKDKDIVVKDVVVKDVKDVKKLTYNINKDKEDNSTNFLNYYNQKTGKHFRLTKSNIDLINTRLKEGFTIEDLKKATDNFILDTWEDRHKYMDLIYCIGVIRKIDMLQKWMNYSTTKTSEPTIEEILKGEYCGKQKR
jgi:uncharacterized phage protein (TIGR02220 family)